MASTEFGNAKVSPPVVCDEALTELIKPLTELAAQYQVANNGPITRAIPPATINPTVTGRTGDSLDSMVAKALRDQLAMRNKTVAENVNAFMTPKPEPIVEKKTEAVVLKNGQVTFTTLTGVKEEKLNDLKLKDFGVTVCDPTVFPPAINEFIPNVKKGYNIQVKEAHALLMAWEMGEKSLITGPTGSGKSSLIEHCCALTKRPFIRVNMTGDIESTVLFGQLVVENGATVWKDGPVTEAVRHGAVLLIDEWDVTPPEILFGLQWLFEEEGKLFIKEMPGDSKSKFLIPHENFRLVCAGNTVGQGDDTGRYSGTNVQNNASIDRFQTTIVLNYLAPEHEEKIVYDCGSGVTKPTIKKMVSFANMIRTACNQNDINLTMSPRTLINWAKKIGVYGDVKHALSLAFINKLRDSDAKVVNEIYIKIFGKD